jgi:hypothetical protein
MVRKGGGAMRRITAVGAAIVMCLVGVGSARAGHGVSDPPGNRDRRDNAFQLRVGGFFPSGGGDVWEANEAFFTLDVEDLNDSVLGLSFVTSASNWLDFRLSADFYEGSALSAERGIVDDFGYPILHDTRLALVPLTADFRILPGGRFHRGPGGSYILRPAFYFGGGLGVTVWEYEESGEFVDFSTPDWLIYAGTFQDEGVALETHLLAGLELPMGPSWGLLFEGRYSWADDELNSPDFPDFGRLNLGGPSVYMGASFRF